MMFRKNQTLGTSLGVIFLIFFTSCGPKLKPRSNTTVPGTPIIPQEEIIYKSEDVKPTLNIPKSDTFNNTIFQEPPKKVINNNKTEILLGRLSIMNAKIAYNSLERKMNLTGQILIKNIENSILVEQEFSLIGSHEMYQGTFALHDEMSSNSVENKPIVKAKAHCLGLTNSNLSVNCNHVVIDIFALYNKTYYTEQVEVNRLALNPPAPETPAPETPAPETPAPETPAPETPAPETPAPETPAPETPTPETPTPETPAPETPTPETPTPETPAPETPAPETPAPPVDDENKDQTENHQKESSDESIPGRYQGSAQTVNLEALFAENAPKENKNENPPSAPPVRPTNQSIGFANDGSLQNSTSLLLKQKILGAEAFFEIVNPQRLTHFTTFEMSELIHQCSKFLNDSYSKKLFVSNISKEKGGKLSPHVSHQNGLDVDLGYISDRPNLKFPLVVQMNTQEYFQKNISIEKTYHLFKYFFTQNDFSVERIFIDQKIKNELCKHANSKNEFSSDSRSKLKIMFESLQHINGHGDHFHLRLKCSKFDIACRDRIYKKMDACLN